MEPYHYRIKAINPLKPSSKRFHFPFSLLLNPLFSPFNMKAEVPDPEANKMQKVSESAVPVVKGPNKTIVKESPLLLEEMRKSFNKM